MKLTLKNFRCWEDKTFDFGEIGLILLSGSSGAGKTSILLAIQFVLYDIGTKLVTFGKTSCSVSFEFGDSGDKILITRSKRPNRVVVIQGDTEYEDDVAQGVIDAKFGKCFDVVSYVSQNNEKSFILMSPMEKLAFLERFAFNGINITDLKMKASSLVKKRNEELVMVTSQLEMASSQFSELKKPEKVLFPLKGTDREKAIKNENVKMSNTKILIKRADKAISELSKKINENKINSVKKDNITSNLFKVKTTLRKLEEENKKIVYIGDENLNILKNKLQCILKNKEYITLKNQFEKEEKKYGEMLERERVHLFTEIKNIKGKLWEEGTLEEIDHTILDIKNVMKDLEKIRELKVELSSLNVKDTITEDRSTLDSLSKKIEEGKELHGRLLLQKELYTCPSCSASLKIDDEGKLIEHETGSENSSILNSDVEENIEKLEAELALLSKKFSSLSIQHQNNVKKTERKETILKKIQEIHDSYGDEGITSQYDEMELNLTYWLKYRATQLENENRMKKMELNLKEERWSSTLSHFGKHVKETKEKLEEMESNTDGDIPDDDEEELRLFINSEESNKKRSESLNKDIEKTQNELSEYECELETINSANLNKDETEVLEEKLKDKEKELGNLKAMLVEIENNLKKVDKYLLYKKEFEEYMKWKKKVNILTEEEEKKRKRYSAVTQWKDKILEAESIAILNIINSINTHSQSYLDIFFPDHPIVVRLQPFKITKKKEKPQINIEIDYRGNQCDMSSLSGGEVSRVVLAFTLALTEIFNTPILLLDECTASLDQDLTSTVMEGIRENFSDRLVVVIAHQVVAGHFDRQVEL